MKRLVLVALILTGCARHAQPAYLIDAVPAYCLLVYAGRDTVAREIKTCAAYDDSTSGSGATE